VKLQGTGNNSQATDGPHLWGALRRTAAYVSGEEGIWGGREVFTKRMLRPKRKVEITHKKNLKRGKGERRPTQGRGKKKVIERKGPLSFFWKFR